MTVESGCVWKCSISYSVWEFWSCNAFNISSPQRSAAEPDAGGAEFQGKNSPLVAGTERLVDLRTTTIQGCFGFLFHHAAFQLFVYDRPDKTVSDAGFGALEAPAPLRIVCHNTVETVTMHQSMETDCERGLIRLSSLKHQSLNVFLVINYCLWCVCIHTYIYSVLGTLKEKIIYLVIMTLVVMMGDF